MKQLMERTCPRTFVGIPLARLRASKRQANREICKSFESSTVTIAVSRSGLVGMERCVRAEESFPRCLAYPHKWYFPIFRSCSCSCSCSWQQGRHCCKIRSRERARRSARMFPVVPINLRTVKSAVVQNNDNKKDKSRIGDHTIRSSDHAIIPSYGHK